MVCTSHNGLHHYSYYYYYYLGVFIVRISSTQICLSTTECNLNIVDCVYVRVCVCARVCFRVAESTEEVTKLRPVRLIREDGIIRPYDLTESQGYDFFQVRKKLIVLLHCVRVAAQDRGRKQHHLLFISSYRCCHMQPVNLFNPACHI